MSDTPRPSPIHDALFLGLLVVVMVGGALACVALLAWLEGRG